MNKQLFTSMVAQYTKQPKWADGDTLEWSDGAHCYLPSLVFNGECKQDGTPTPDNPLPIYSFDGTVYVRGRDSYIYTPVLNGMLKTSTSTGNLECRDEWDYVTGKGLRRIYKVVFDGKTGYKQANSYGILTQGVAYCGLALKHKAATTGGKPFISTHFKGSWSNVVGCMYTTNLTTVMFTVDANKYPNKDSVNAWLAEQYENGTPVIFYYAMETPIPFEERSEYDVYEPIPNDSGHIDTIDSGIQPPFNITYITHS